VIHPEAYDILVGHYGGPDKVNPARLRMAHAPEGAELIHNPVSKAPGFRMANVYVMAGVPRIMQNMLEGLSGKLKGGAPVRSTSIDAGMPEGILAEGFGQLQTRYPDVDMGSYPYFRNGKAGTSLVMRSSDTARLAAATDEVRGLIRRMGGNPIDEVVS
jgi:molybdopterin-biosynthesis enzyme MoeA-like protein